MRKLFPFLFLLILLKPVSGQRTNAKLDEAVQYFNSGEMDKGISMMEKIISQEPSDDNWDMLIKMYYYRYEHAKDIETNSIIEAIGQTMGIEMDHPNYASSEECFADLINKSREASLYAQSASASQMLRNYFVDYTPDTAVSAAARSEFEIAEDFFAKKDYKNSKLHYKNALNFQPDYYKAILYLGDCYWYLNNMDSAIFYFQKGIELHPGLLEPRKYLVDALGYSNKNDQAKEECIYAIYIYPDQSIFLKYADLIERENKVFDKHWIKRGCEINNIDYAEPKTADKYWSVYQSAENEIKEFCDSNGIIIKQNKLSTAKYLEVYAWQKMLNSSKYLPEELKFAKEMADLGYLDCYVFISQFHFDLYAQYLDFAKNNKERIKYYIETYLIE